MSTLPADPPPPALPPTLAGAARAVLICPDPAGKIALTRRAAAAWSLGTLAAPPEDAVPAPPTRPGRPAQPELLPPAQMPARRGNAAGRIALLHALAHIELNAIDLAWDMVARYADAGRAGLTLPRAFFDDWVTVAAEEAHHFTLLQERLAEQGSHYGALPAHDGLWQAAVDTAHDLAARLAVVPMVLEARGLDVTPATIERLTRAGDHASVRVLETILEDEIGHVAAGRRWFEHVCADRGETPVETWQALVRRYFRGALKRPFNRLARDRAGFHSAFYEPIALD